MVDTTSDAGLKAKIRDHYAERAVAAGQAKPCSCGCSPSTEAIPQDEMARGLYAVDETSDLPAEAGQMVAAKVLPARSRREASRCTCSRKESRSRLR